LTNDLKNSVASPHSNGATFAKELLCVLAALVTLAGLSACWFFKNGYLLYYGDAQAHLNISRGILDSKTPGYEQIGSVWLPVLHLICLPFVGNNWLWTTGLAGAIPVSLCFVIAGVFFFFAARMAYDDRLAAIVTLACFALNPNILYLASIPMTEAVFLAELAVALFSILRFRQTQQRWLIWLAGLAILLATLTRYDGWFLIPFTGLALAIGAVRRRWLVFVEFCLVAGLGPLYWLAHNFYIYGDALEFYRGPYSAMAIYQRALDAGLERYRGDHQFGYAIEYYAAAGRLCTGVPLLWLGFFGLLCALVKRRILPILFLSLTPLFYIWSIYSSGTPIFVPNLWPFSYYNTRYGIAVLPLAAFAAGALVLVIPARWRTWALLIPLIACSVWIVSPSREKWINWKESQVNSVSRRAWTNAAASFLRKNYEPGQGILASSGDVTGILCAASIPLKQSLNIGNGDEWLVTVTRPDLYHRPMWAVAQAGDSLSKALDTANWKLPVYRVVEEIQVKDAPVLLIYRRTNESSVFDPQKPGRKLDDATPGSKDKEISPKKNEDDEQ
jgi:Dolichyl-phosphate-mannose-protein mannosyltransferase